MSHDHEQAASKDSSLQVAAIVVALLVTVGMAWLFLNHKGDTARPAQQTGATGNDERTTFKAGTDASLAIDTAMQMAEMAFQAGHVAEPVDGSAVFFYRQVLSLDPANARAVEGMHLIATQLTDEALEQIGKRNYEAAITRLELLNDIEPESDNVAIVRKSLVEKSRIMYAAMDRALQREELEKAEYYARRVAVFPDADNERITAALQTIASARQQQEAGVAVDGSPESEVVTSEYTSAGAVALIPAPKNIAENPGSEGVAMADTQPNTTVPTAQVNTEADTLQPTAQVNTETDTLVSTAQFNPGTEIALPIEQVSTEANIVIPTAQINTETDAVVPDSQDVPGAATTLTAGASAEPPQTIYAGPPAGTDAAVVPGEIISPDTVNTLARQVESLLTTASQRVAASQLVNPPDNSAAHYYRQVLRLDNSNSVAKRGLRSLVQMITADALQQADTGDWDGADRMLAAAADIGYAGNLLAQTRSQLKELRLAAEKIKIINIDQFTVEKTVTPKYPRRAVSRSVEGWVTLEFVVSETGETRDIKVVESSTQYANQFARAAITAVEQWRFQPRKFDGEAIAQRSKTTVQFKLTD